MLQLFGFAPEAEEEDDDGLDKDEGGPAAEAFDPVLVFLGPGDEGDGEEEAQADGERAADAQAVFVAPEGDAGHSAEDEQADQDVPEFGVGAVEVGDGTEGLQGMHGKNAFL